MHAQHPAIWVKEQLIAKLGPMINGSHHFIRHAPLLAIYVYMYLR